MPYKIKNPYPKTGTIPVNRKGKVDKKSEGKQLKDGRSKLTKHQ